MQERAEYRTNRIDLFCRKWLDGDSDEIRRKFIQWNADWFRHSPTFWLPIGRLFWIAEPAPPSRPVLAWDGVAISFPDHGHRILIALPQDLDR